MDASGDEPRGPEPRGAGLRAVTGPTGREPPVPPRVRLRREYKGPTAAELANDEDLAAKLPGQARSALAALQRGDYRAAEAALPGAVGAVLAFPSAGRRNGRWRRLAAGIALLLLVAAAVLALALP